MHNKSSKNGSERFWPTPVAQPSQRETTGGKNISHTDGTKYGTSIAQAVRDPNYTTTSSLSTEPTTPESTCSQVDFLANLSVSPGSDSARQMTERSGRKCCELLGKPSLLGSLVKTLLESSRWNSTISFLTWKASATPRGRLLFRLVPSMPDTDETGCGLWPTPQANKTTESGDIVNADGTEWDGKSKPHGAATGKPITTALADKVKMWPTPSVCGNYNRAGASPTSGDGLATKVKMWPTPTSHLAKETNAPSEANRNEPSISSIVGGSLNPQFVEWLMGYPKDWTEVQDFASGRKKTMPLQESLPESSTERTV